MTTHAATKKWTEPGLSPPPQASWEDRDLVSPGRDPVRIRLYGALTNSSPVLLWVHGGSWVRGSVEDWHPSMLSLAERIRGTVAAVRYGLAPTVHHPAPILDVVAAVEAIRAVIGPHVPLVLGGDSAGGTLAASAVMRLPGEISAQVLAYPPFDPLCNGASFDDFSGKFPGRGQLRSAWATYAGSGPAESGIPVTPLAYPDLSQAPPTSLIVGQEDPVRDDVMAYADRLRRSAVNVRASETDLIQHGDFLSPTRAMLHPLHTWIAEETNRYFIQGPS